jgi:AraC-like DNA-binding protein
MDFSKMSYREAAPPDDVSSFVLSFWEFTVRDEDFPPITHEIFPDGCVSLLYHRNKNLQLSRLAFSGLHLESVTARVFPGDIYWGMRISPACCARILRCRNMSKFQPQKVFEAGEFPHLTENLLEKLNACRNFAEAIAVYQKRLRETGLDRGDFDAKVAQAVRLIEESGGEIKISRLAESVNLSPRQFERRFKQNAGLTPKQFARVRRIRATAVSLVEKDAVNWAHRAAEMGFTDQSHLTHEFVSVTKRSPNSFAAKVKQIEHGNLVK